MNGRVMYIVVAEVGMRPSMLVASPAAARDRFDRGRNQPVSTGIGLSTGPAHAAMTPGKPREIVPLLAPRKRSKWRFLPLLPR
jgi:hypothetical protein